MVRGGGRMKESNNHTHERRENSKPQETMKGRGMMEEERRERRS